MEDGVRRLSYARFRPSTELRFGCLKVLLDNLLGLKSIDAKPSAVDAKHAQSLAKEACRACVVRARISLAWTEVYYC